MIEQIHQSKVGVKILT